MRSSKLLWIGLLATTLQWLLVVHCGPTHRYRHDQGLLADLVTSLSHSSGSFPGASTAADGTLTTAAAAAGATVPPDGQQSLQQQPRQTCRNGTRQCGRRCVRLTDPAACGSACTRCPKPAANGIATCNAKKGVCGVSCAKGYEPAIVAGKAAADCRLCGPNTFKAVAGPGPCSPCPAGAFTRQASAEDCRPITCPPGMQLDQDGQRCVVCPTNTTKTGTNAESCQPCPEGSQTFGSTAQSHDDPSDCLAGGLIEGKNKTGRAFNPAEALADFDWQYERALNNTGPKRLGKKPKTSSTKACLYECDGVPDVDQPFSVKVAHIAGSPAVYYSNDPSLVRSGVNLVSAVRDQQSCGTCVSHALASAAETAVAAAMRIDAHQLDISHNFSYFCAAFYTASAGGGKSCSTGWDLGEALKAMEASSVFFMNTSCLRNAKAPDVSQLTDAQLTAFCTTDLPVTCTRASFTCKYKALSEGPSQIQRYIRLHGSVVTRIKATESFFSFFEENPTGVFNGTSTNASEPAGPSFLHAVQLIGYNNEERWFLAKNSYSAAWGDQGLFRIAYGVADVGHPEDTFALTNCDTTSNEKDAVAAWSDQWPVTADTDKPGCLLYTATARDTISGIADHFQIDILAFIEDNTQRGVIPTLDLGEPPRPEPQLQPDPSWDGTVFRVCNIPEDIFDRVAADPCTAYPNYCNGRQDSCRAGRCVCPDRYQGPFCEQDLGVQRNFTLVNGETYVLHTAPQLNWMNAQQRCEQDGMRLVRLYNPVHAAEVYRQVLQLTSESIWLGLNDRRQEGQWVWVGGNSSSAASDTPADFLLWRDRAPDNKSDENCVDVWPTVLKVTLPNNDLTSWNDYACDALRVYICGPVEDSNDPCSRFPCSSVGMRPPVGCAASNSSNSYNGRECQCDAGLSYVSDEVGCVEKAPVLNVFEFQLGGVSHALYLSPTTWTEADRICRQRGMGLVKLSSQDYTKQLHDAVLAEYAKRGGEWHEYWIGLNDRAREGRFVWSSDGAAVGDYQLWEQGEPSNSCFLRWEDGSCVHAAEDCVLVWKQVSGTWNDEVCWSKRCFVCSG